MKNRGKIIKRFIMSFAVIFAAGCFIYFGWNYYQGPDPYTHAEKYTIKASEQRTMASIVTFFKNNPSYELPAGSFLEPSQRQKSENGYRYMVYFYDKVRDNVIFAYVRGSFENPNKTTIGLVSVLNSNSVGKLEDIHATILWQDINHDLPKKENRRVKKLFKNQILMPIKEIAMKSYELSEFTFLLKQGMWCGGNIAGFGYVSAARGTDRMNMPAGLTGVRLSNSVMLERSVPRSSAETEMMFSVYDPYTGRYSFFEATANFKGDVGEALLSMIATPHKQGRWRRIKLSRRRGIYVTTYKLSPLSMEPVTRRLR